MMCAGTSCMCVQASVSLVPTLTLRVCSDLTMLYQFLLLSSYTHFLSPNSPIHPDHALCTVEKSCDSHWEFLQLTVDVLWTLRMMRFDWRRASAELRNPLFHGGGFGHQGFLPLSPLPLSLSLSLSLSSFNQSRCSFSLR